MSDTPQQAVGHTCRECEDHFHHTFGSPETVVLDIYKTGEVVLLVKNGVKQLIVECGKTELRSQLEASQAECAQLNRELGKRFDLEKVIDERDDDLNGLKLDLEKAQAECERLRKDKELIVEAIRSAPCPPSNSNGDYKCRYSRNSIAASWWSCACPLHVLIGEDLSKKPYAAMQPASGKSE